MIALKRLGGVLKNTFGLTMGESKQPSGSTKSSRSTKSSQEGDSRPRMDTGDHSRNHATHMSIVQRPLNKDEAKGDWQEVKRRSRKPIQERKQCRVRELEDINRGLESKLLQCQHELQAQRCQYKELKQDFGRIQKENYGLRNEHDELAEYKKSHMFFKARYDYTVEHLFLPYAQKRSLQFDDRTGEALRFVLSPMLLDAQEAEALRDQVQILRKELLTREKKVAAISDEQFASDFFKLASQIKTLSRLLRPYEGVDVLEALGSCIMASGVAPHHWSGRVGRKLFIEAWIWSTLMQMVFRNPFTIFGVESGAVANLWSSMFGSEHCHGWPTPSSPCETWRHRTMEQLVAVVDEDIITQGKTEENYLYLEQCVVDARASVTSAIETGLATITSEVDSSQVLQIVHGAFTLLMHMSVQLPRLQINFPGYGEIYDKTEMKPQALLDEEDDIDHGIVAAVVNPGLMKWGDVQGKNHDHHYAIVPALVRLQASGEAKT
ncbi:hypothetical protein BKA63DRAFT_587954 [Paraphoma chrysanthemicola]|nr:hypothetical protein BKA63DRAFT_587954 [Paraphoma chrysanthemicola]